MSDDSHLDQRYFIDNLIWNCPFCNRRHLRYSIFDRVEFDWSTAKRCYVWFMKCHSCDNRSMHLTFTDLFSRDNGPNYLRYGADLDAAFFYSVPTSFFTIDTRVPAIIRELITEAEGCVRMNFLTGASACCRKAIYELTVRENAEGPHYEDRIKSLKGKFPAVDPNHFDILCHIKDMTSGKVHEQSWDKWDSKHLTLFLETLKTILHEIYVIPDEKKSRLSKVQSLLQKIKGKPEETGEL